jgi:hypothetical protein
LGYTEAGLRQDQGKRKRMTQVDPGQVASAEQMARQAALRTLNGLRVIAPALRYAVGTGRTAEAQATAFADFMAKARAFAVAGATALDLEPDNDRNRWAIGMLERAYMEASPKAPLTEGLGQALLQAALAAASERGQDSQVPEPLSDPTALRVALVRGMTPVIVAQQAFNFGRPHLDDDLADVAQRLIDGAMAVLAEQVDPMTADHERQTMVMALIEEGGRLMAQAWETEARIANSLFTQRGVNRDAWRRANPGGFPLTAVYDRFRQQMATFSKLLKTLRPRR